MSGGETESERLDRKLIELLNELRVALPGVQVLFAFLLTLPFSSGFAKTTAFQRDVYASSLVCAVLASILFIAPSSYHRHRFRRLDHETVEDKREMIAAQDRLAIGGFLFLTLAVLRIDVRRVRHPLHDAHDRHRDRVPHGRLRMVLVRAAVVAADARFTEGSPVTRPLGHPILSSRWTQTDPLTRRSSFTRSFWRSVASTIRSWTSPMRATPLERSRLQRSTICA